MKASLLLKYSLVATILFWPVYHTFSNNKYLGINNINLEKIAIGIIDLGLPDSDQDGIDDDLEKALGTNHQKKDTDNDGYEDKTELSNSYSPLGKGKLPIDNKLADRLKNNYLLAVESHGEIWLVRTDSKRYLVGNVARQKLLEKKLNPNEAPQIIAPTTQATENILEQAAQKIRSSDKAGLINLSTPDYEKRLNHTMDTLDSEQKLTWANLLSSAKLKRETDTEKIYSTEVYFGLASKNVTVEYRASKQPDGRWLISQF